MAFCDFIHRQTESHEIIAQGYIMNVCRFLSRFVARVTPTMHKTRPLGKYAAQCVKAGGARKLSLG